jgi:hypothetical protein
MAGMLFLFADSSLFRVFIIAWTALEIVSNRFHENNSDVAIDEVWHPCRLSWSHRSGRREAHASHSQAQSRSEAALAGLPIDGGESEGQTIRHDKLLRVG